MKRSWKEQPSSNKLEVFNLSFVCALCLFSFLFVFCVSDYPVVSRPVIRPVMRRGRGCSKIALRCDFNIKSRRKAAILTRVEWFVDKKRTKVETVRGSHGELMENTYGFKAGTTVSLKGF